MTCAPSSFSIATAAWPACSCELACSLAHSASELLEAAMAEQLPPGGGSPWPPASDGLEALRCEQCGEPLCVFACKSGALQRDPITGRNRPRRYPLRRLLHVPDGVPLRRASGRGARPGGALRCVPGPRNPRLRDGLSHGRAGHRSGRGRSARQRVSWPGSGDRLLGRRDRRLRGGPRARPGLLHHAGDRGCVAAVLAAAALLCAGGGHRSLADGLARAGVSGEVGRAGAGWAKGGESEDRSWRTLSACSVPTHGDASSRGRQNVSARVRTRHAESVRHVIRASGRRNGAGIRFV